MLQWKSDNIFVLTNNVTSGCPIIHPESKLTRINELCERDSEKV